MGSPGGRARLAARSEPQLARILAFSSGSLCLSPHLFPLRAPLPRPFPERLESQTKTRRKKKKEKEKQTDKQDRQKSWRLLLAPRERSAGAGCGAALRRGEKGGERR